MSIPRPPNAPPKVESGVTTMKLDLTPRKPGTPCPRIVYYAVEGFGKTTFGCQAPSPVVVAARDERGVQRLIDAGSIQPVPVIDCNTWPETLGVLDQLATTTHDRKTVVVDSLAAFERLCHEHIIMKEFSGKAGDDGFLAFGRGTSVAINEWAKFLSRLDAINRKGIAIVLLGHAVVEKFKNPTGSDFDRFTCRMDAKAWGAIKAWADCVWFGNYLTITAATAATKGARHKGIGGTDRIVYTNRRDTHDAKPGYTMPEEINLPDSPDGIWHHLTSSIFGESK